MHKVYRDRESASAACRRHWYSWRVLASLGLFGCAFSLMCDVAMWFVIDGYNPFGQTISELAAGPHHWLQDLGLVVFAVGVVCVALGTYLWGSHGKSARLLQGALVLLALDVSLVGLWNEYGDGQPGGIVIHRYLVWALYALVPTILWLEASVEPVRGGRMTRFGKPVAIVWLIAAPIYKVVPSHLDGAYERLLAVVLIGSVAIAAYRLYHASNGDPV